MFRMPEHLATEPGAGPLVRQARTRARMPLRELARRIGVSAGTLSAVENGKTGLTVERLGRIADALGTSAADLLAARTAPEERPPAPGRPWRTFAPLDLDPVLRAAIATFVVTGYHGATMRLVAANARMSVPGVYHHYPSKQHLLAAILDVAMTELHWRIPAARADGGTSVERFANMVEALALFHAQRRDLAFIGASEMRSFEEPNRSRIAASRTEIQRLLDSEVDAAIRDGEFATRHPRDAARAVATMCTSLPQWFRADGPTSPEQIAAEYAQFAVDLMRGSR
ncbi:conserved hypothetical protein [Streptomyces sp. AA4]|nr:conserved hypothetical protein [Streptomyces sp. AA4]